MKVIQLRDIPRRDRHGLWRRRFPSKVFIIFGLVLGLPSCGSLTTTSGLPHPPGYGAYSEALRLPIAVAPGPDGKLWRVTTSSRYAYVDFSTDRGQTFSSPIRLNADSQTIRTTPENRPDIQVDREGRVYVVYPAQGRQASAVFFSVSDPRGGGFSRPAPLSDKSSEASFFQARLTLAPTGKVLAFWHDERDRTDWEQIGNSIYVTSISSQKGTAPNRKIVDSVCECCRLAISIDPDGLPLVLTRLVYPGGIRDHGILKPDRASGQWENWRVTNDGWHVEACPEHGPALAADSLGTVHIAWFTQGSARQGLYYARSTDGGRTFSTPVPLGNPSKLPSYPALIARDNRVVAAWREFDGMQSTVIVMRSHDRGATWSRPEPASVAHSEADYPLLWLDGDTIMLAWNSAGEGFRTIAVDPKPSN